MSTENKAIPNEVKVLVFQWSNLLNKYMPLMGIEGTLDGASTARQQCVPFNDLYDFGELGLKSMDSDSLPPLIKHMLPGDFASKLLATIDPAWHRSSDLARLVKLGSREIGCYRIAVASSEEQESMISTQTQLNDLLGKIHVALSKNELDGILDKSNFYSLTSTKGAQPKLEYQDYDGNRWIVKTSHHDVNSLASAKAKMEAACLAMLDECDVPVPKLKVHETPEGRSVLMVRRFDLDGPKHQPGKVVSTFDHRFKFVDGKMLGELHAAENNSLRRIEHYGDLMKTFGAYAKADTASEDKINLMRKAIFDTLINNTEARAESTNFFEDAFDGVRVAPFTGAIPDPIGNPFAMPISHRYPNQASVKLDDEFISELSKTFGVTETEAKHELAKVAGVVAEANDYMKFFQMSDEEIKQYSSSILDKSQLQKAIADYAPEDSRHKFRKQFMATLSKENEQSASPSLS